MIERVLRRHFIDQAIDTDVFAGTADARRWSLGAVGLLGLAGGLAAMLLLPDPRTIPLTDPEALRAFSRPDRIMAIIAAMVGSGLLSCAIWPWMVFDRRDVEVLTGLPLSAPAIVKAKLSALCVIVLVCSCGTQLPAAFVFGWTYGPSIVTSLYTAAVHVVVQVAAGVFVFLFIAATQAVALVLLGPRSFVKFSAAVQAVLTALIVAAVTYAPDLYFGVRNDLRAFAGPVPPWLAHGPLGWFLGAYDVLLGSRVVASIQQAESAAVALGACVVITLVIYPVMYHRLARLAIEQAKWHARRRTRSLVERVAQWLAPPSTMLGASDRTAQATAVFVLLSLIRSPRHRQVLAVALGLAAAYCVPSILRWWPYLAAPPIQPPAELLSVPIEGMFILVAGLLLAVSVPSEPGSRWVWRATEPDRPSLRSAVRRVTFLVGVVPIVALMTPVYWFGWGPLVALWHAATCIAIGGFVIVVTTIGRRTEPCAWPLAGPGPAPLVIGVWYLGAYYLFTNWFPTHERQLFDSPATLGSALAGLCFAGLIASLIGNRGAFTASSVRTIFKTSLAALIVVVGLTWAFGRGLTRSVPQESPQETPSSTLSAVPALPAPPKLIPIPSRETAAMKAAYRLALERAPATAALACIQEALGGVQVLAGVSSLRIVGTTTPTATTSTAPVASTREIGMVFPDRYRRSDVQADAAMPATRLEFMQQVLTRLPREIAGVRLSQRITRDAGQDRLALDASGPEGLDATLWADLGTCMPFALEYRQASTTTEGSSDTYRIDFSDYRRFGGILFPTLLRTAKNGAPWEEEHVSEVQVNASLGEEYFRRGGGWNARWGVGSTGGLHDHAAVVSPPSSVSTSPVM